MFRSYKRTQLSYLPYVLDIEPTTYCNFKCQMCHVSDPDFKHQHMSFDLFKKIIDENPQLIKIKLQGMGEPLLCPDFFKMAEYARKKGVLVQTTTNGSMLIEENIQKLIHAKLTSIGVSLDGASAETFEGIRGGSNFNKVVAGVGELAKALKQAGSKTVLRAWTVVQKKNIHEAEQIVGLAAQLGFDAIVFQTHLSNWGKQAWSDKMDGITAENSTLNRQGLVEIGKKKGINVSFYQGDVYSKQKPCIWPWHTAYVSADGFLVPCCILGDSSVKNFGNLNQQSIAVFWNSLEYSEFRAIHNSMRIPDYCMNCYR